MKRRQRAGLPIYPNDVTGGGKTTPSYPRYRRGNNIHVINTNNNLLSPSLVSPSLHAAAAATETLSTPTQVPIALNSSGYRTPLSLFDIFNSSVTNNSYLPNPTTYSLPFKFFQENNVIGGGGGGGGGLALSLSSSSHLPPPNSLSMSNCMQYNINCLNFGANSIEQRTSGGGSGGGDGTGGVELSSIQSSFIPGRTTTTMTTTTTSSGNNGSDDYNMIGTTSSDADDHEDDFLKGNSGLLEDLIDESQTLMSRSEKSKDMTLSVSVPARTLTLTPAMVPAPAPTLTQTPTPAIEMIKSEDNYLWDYKVMESLNLGQGKHVQDSTSPAHSSISKYNLQYYAEIIKLDFINTILLKLIKIEEFKFIKIIILELW